MFWRAENVLFCMFEIRGCGGIQMDNVATDGRMNWAVLSEEKLHAQKKVGWVDSECQEGSLLHKKQEIQTMCEIDSQNKNV